MNSLQALSQAPSPFASPGKLLLSLRAGSVRLCLEAGGRDVGLRSGARSPISPWVAANSIVFFMQTLLISRFDAVQMPFMLPFGYRSDTVVLFHSM